MKLRLALVVVALSSALLTMSCRAAQPKPRVEILSSNGEVRRRIADGEFAVGIADTDDANVARQEGKPIRIVYPDKEGIGPLIIPNCAMLISGGPNPDLGRKFIDHLPRPKTERALAESEAAQIPLRPGASRSRYFSRPASISEIGNLSNLSATARTLTGPKAGRSGGRLSIRTAMSSKGQVIFK